MVKKINKIDRNDKVGERNIHPTHGDTIAIIHFFVPNICPFDFYLPTLLTLPFLELKEGERSFSRLDSQVDLYIFA
ncbi:hypothetical protein GQ457_13G011220 [Hibiscus cannabinus]